MAFQGVERVLHDFLTVALACRVCSELPADLPEVLPLVQAVRIGGPSHVDATTLHLPTFSLDCYAESRQAAHDLSLAADYAVRRQLPGSTILGANIGRVTTVVGPAWRPWDDTTVRRFGATYQLWLKDRA